MARPVLDGVELQQVQEIASDDAEAVETHAVPVLEGDFLQDLGRRAVRFTLNGVVLGATAGDGLKTLREKFRAAQPVSFVSDIATATTVDKVLIEDVGIRELAGKPQRFEYALTLREFIPPPAPAQEPPPVKPIPPPLTSTLIVEVIVTGQPAFDFSTVTVSADGTQDDGTPLSRVLTTRTNNVWTEADFPPGSYTAKAVVTAPQPMSGTAHATIAKGQTVKVTITLAPGSGIAKGFVIHFWFDKAFIEPCLREVAQRIAAYATAHPDEKMVIVGNTDLTGSDEYNQSLSERRGRSVFAMLTFGRDPDAALAEWKELRKIQAGQPTVNDHWGVREYQWMLQDLDYYSGNIDEQHGPQTDAGVRSFQTDRGLPVTGSVDPATWDKLSEAYMAAASLAVPASQFLENANDGGCDGGILRWLGCGEEHPIRNTQDAWRPNRRTEVLFIAAAKPPCQVAKPVTFDLQPPSGTTWCLDDGTASARCCFMSNDDGADGMWQVTPAEPGSVTVSGSITFDDGTPLANANYILTAPDGEYMDGEHPAPPNSGRPVPGQTAADGSFAYPDKPKGVGIYILTVLGPYVVRLASEPPGSEKGNSVCMHMDGSAPFRAIIAPAPTGLPQHKLRGTLFDEFGQPLGNTAATFTFDDGSTASATTAADGQFVAQMGGAFSTAKIQYATPRGANVTYDFFIDVQDAATDEGVKRRLSNIGYPAQTDLAAAITGFQGAQGLDTTGETDDATRAKLATVHDGTDPLVPPFPADETPLDPSTLRGVGD
jgi:outer membrane protein OmpA-like peptidoglycan-associated protein